MGLGLFHNCNTNYSYDAPAPNPNPSRYKILEVWNYPNAYILKVHYFDATNFEGIKLMVYKGKFNKNITTLDPHFTPDSNSPIARFRPDKQGLVWAQQLAEKI